MFKEHRVSPMLSLTLFEYLHPIISGSRPWLFRITWR